MSGRAKLEIIHVLIGVDDLLAAARALQTGVVDDSVQSLKPVGMATEGDPLAATNCPPGRAGRLSSTSESLERPHDAVSAAP
jgi:hypothetical protein